jgi:hypothetical protein
MPPNPILSTAPFLAEGVEGFVYQPVMAEQAMGRGEAALVVLLQRQPIALHDA